MRRHLVIQGPLRSWGHSGASRGTSWEVVDHDCRPGIAHLVAEHGHLFDRIVVSTWSDAVGTSGELGGARIVRTDPADAPALHRRVTSERPPGIDNLFRLYLSMRAGLDALDAAPDDTVIRIRTDQQPVMPALVAAGDGVPEGRVGVMSFRPCTTYALSDFYNAGKHADLRAFAAAVLVEPERPWFGWAHQEPVFKYAAARGCPLIRHRADHRARPLSGPPVGAKWLTGRQRAIADWAMRHLFWPLPEAVLDGLVWRGAPVNAGFIARRRVDEVFAEAYPDFLAAPARTNPDWQDRTAGRLRAAARWLSAALRD
jgi:hypothetical protein